MTWKCKFLVKTSTDANYSAPVARTQYLCSSSWMRLPLRILSSVGRQMRLQATPLQWILAQYYLKLREQLTALRATLELIPCLGALRVFAGTLSTTCRPLISKNSISSPQLCQTAWLRTLEDGNTTTPRQVLSTTTAFLRHPMPDCSLISIKVLNELKKSSFKFIVILL